MADIAFWNAHAAVPRHRPGRRQDPDGELRARLRARHQDSHRRREAAARRHRGDGRGVRQGRRDLREQRAEGHRLRGRPWRRDQAGLRLPHRICRARGSDLGRYSLQSQCHQIRHRRRSARARGRGRPPRIDAGGLIQRIVAHHVTPREAGRVFAQAKPRLAAYTHFVLLASEQIPPPTLDDILAETRQTYDGPLQLGEDLMSFEIGETITVHRRQR